MNERITELASQLGPVATIGNWGRVEWAYNVYPQLGDKMYAAIDLEKFAQLIIQDCVEVCAGIAAVRAGYNDAAGRDTAYSCGDMIREHFGIEE